MRKLLCILAFLSFSLLPLAAQKKEEAFIFTPQWTAQAQFAGYYVAQEKGFYSDAGVTVQIIHPNGTQSSVDRIRSNTSHATTLQLAQAIEIIDKGVPLVNVLQTSMNNALVIVSRHGHNPLEDKGASVAIWRAGFSQLAHCMAQELDLEYNWVEAANVVNIFIAGAVDAAVAMSYNEYYQILQSGIPITDDTVYRFSEHNYNIQEDGVYVTREYYKKHKEQVEAFAAASRRGWEYAAEHPEETLEIVMGFVKRNHIATNPVIQQLMLDEILRLQLDPDSGERTFSLRPDMVDLANKLMLDSQMISRPITMEELSR